MIKTPAPWVAWASVALVTLAVACGAPRQPAQPADLVFLGGAVHTMVESGTRAEALAVADGRIVFVGDDTGARRWVGDGTEVIELGGRMLLPGFQDCHLHPISGGVELGDCDLNPLESAEAVLQKVAECAAGDPEAEWVRGGGFQLPLFAGGSPTAAISLKMGRIPEDRIDTGLMMDLSVEENLVLENHASNEFQRFGLMKSGRIQRFSDELIAAYGIKTAGREAVTKSLSGGNLQKVMLARELAGRPDVVVASQPTRGLDVGAMEYIHQRLLQERERGAGILLISEDLDEVFNLSDRIVVLYEGHVMGEAAGEDASREQVGLWMSGVQR